MTRCIGVVEDTFTDPSTGISHPCGYVCSFTKPDRAIDCREKCPDLYRCLLSVAEEVDLEYSTAAVHGMSGLETVDQMKKSSTSVTIWVILFCITIVLFVVILVMLVHRICRHRQQHKYRKTHTDDAEEAKFEAEESNDKVDPPAEPDTVGRTRGWEKVKRPEKEKDAALPPQTHDVIETHSSS